MRRTKKPVKRGKAAGLKAKRLVRRDEVRVKGGSTAAPGDVVKTPTPGGPIPIPYPNVAKES